MRTSPFVHGEFDQLLLACSEGCGLHLRMRAILTGTRLYYSMLLVVFSHILVQIIIYYISHDCIIMDTGRDPSDSLCNGL